MIESDLRWISRLAEAIETGNTELRQFHWREVVRQFNQSLRRELDFTAECRHAERIAANFVGYVGPDSAAAESAERASAPEQEAQPPLIVIPKVYWQWTGERVCVQEYIEGIPGRDLAAAEQAGLDRKVLARRGVNAVLKMIAIDGLFHADPHPGNVFYLPDNRIAFIDFGMVGRLSDERRDQLVHLLLGLVQQEPTLVTNVLLDWAGDSIVNEEALTAELQAFVDQHLGIPLKQLRLGTMLADLVGILRSHQLYLPPDLALFIKAFVSLEGMGRDLDPDLDLAGEAVPMLREALLTRYAPAALAKRGWHAASEISRLMSDLPRDISHLLRSARRGRLEIHIDVGHLKHVGDQLDGATNRLIIGIIVASIIVGSSVVMTVSGGPTLFGLPFFGLLGFVFASIGGVLLTVSISRSNKAERERKS